MFAGVGLGILSWRGYESLRLMLDALTSNKFHLLFGERVIYFHEIDDVCRSIALEHGFEARGVPDNRGIYGGFRGLSESMTSRHVLLLENDWRIHGSYESVYSQLRCGLNLLLSGRAHVIQLRCLPPAFPSGEIKPYRDSRKYYGYYPSAGSSFFIRCLGFLRRFCRPFRSRVEVGWSPYYHTRPDELFDIVTRDSSTNFYLLPSSHRVWSNNPFLIERDFFIDVLLSRVEAVNSRRLVNGFKSIEIELNSSWWRRSGFTVAVANPGMFVHKRVGDRGY